MYLWGDNRGDVCLFLCRDIGKGREPAYIGEVLQQGTAECIIIGYDDRARFIAYSFGNRIQNRYIVVADDARCYKGIDAKTRTNC